MPLRKMSRVLDLAHDEYRVGIDQNPVCVCVCVYAAELCKVGPGNFLLASVPGLQLPLQGEFSSLELLIVKPGLDEVGKLKWACCFV